MKRILSVTIILFMIFSGMNADAQEPSRPGWRGANLRATVGYFDTVSVDVFMATTVFNAAVTITPSLTVRNNIGGAGADSLLSITFVAGQPVLTFNSASGAGIATVTIDDADTLRINDATVVRTNGLLMQVLGEAPVWGHSPTGLAIEGTSEFDGNVYFDNWTRFGDNIKFILGEGNDFDMMYDDNGAGDDLRVFRTYVSDANNSGAWFISRNINPNAMTDHDNYLSPSPVWVNDENADANDYIGVVQGWRAQADVEAQTYYDFYSMVGSADGTPDATTTEIGAIFRFGNAGTATTGHGVTAGGVLFEDDVEVDGTVYADNNVIVYGKVRSTIGAVGSPQFAYAGDTSSGMYFPRVASVGIAAKGVNVATFDSVGIAMNNVKLSEVYAYQTAAALWDVDPTISALYIWLTPTDAGTEQDQSNHNLDLTYVDASNFDTEDQILKGVTFALDFDATDDYLTAADAAAWSFNGTTDAAWSFGAWIQVVAGADTQAVANKWVGSGTEDREWSIYLDESEKLTFEIFDDAANQNGTNKIDAALTDDTWYFVVHTYDGTGGATPCSDAATVWYVDGVVVAESQTNQGAYDDMQAGASGIKIGALDDGALANFFDGDMGAMFFANTEWSADAVWQAYLSTRGYYGE